MPNYKCFQWCNEVVYVDKWGDVEKVMCKKCKSHRIMQRTTEDVTPRPKFARPKMKRRRFLKREDLFTYL